MPLRKQTHDRFVRKILKNWTKCTRIPIPDPVRYYGKIRGGLPENLSVVANGFGGAPQKGRTKW
ncbi:MAG: hypothetical protein OHK0029_13770 [Armatimonadaceae bacterium]